VRNEALLISLDRIWAVSSFDPIRRLQRTMRRLVERNRGKTSFTRWRSV